MKGSNYNMREPIHELFRQSQSLRPPEVNVRSSVREALEQQMKVAFRLDDLNEMIQRWFSGLKGGLFAGAIVLTVLLAGFFVVNQTTAILSSEVDEDGVSEFIDSGDWSQLL